MKKVNVEYYWELVDKKGKPSGYYTQRPSNWMFVHHLGLFRNKTYKQLIEYKVEKGHLPEGITFIENDKSWLIVPFPEGMTTEQYIAGMYYKV